MKFKTTIFHSDKTGAGPDSTFISTIEAENQIPLRKILQRKNTGCFL